MLRKEIIDLQNVNSQLENEISQIQQKQNELARQKDMILLKK